jgi:multidrug efflux pump subunit AcrB
MIYVKKIEKTDPDAVLAIEWLLNDPYHQKLGITPEEMFDGEVALIHDEDGPIMVVRFQKALRVAIQFNPKTRLRNAKAGAEVVKWFQQIAKQTECDEVIVRPGGKAVQFADKLGFRNFVGKVLGVN